MRTLLLNDSYFLSPLRERLREDLFFASPAPEADLRLGFKPVDISEILQACPFRPDVIILSDSINVRLAYTGLQETGIPTVFYGIDSPMNSFWQLDFARSFDLTFFDQKAQVDQLRREYPGQKNRFHWLPLAADTQLYKKLDLEKQYDLAFVGLLNHANRPKRTWILNELKRQFDIKIFDGGGTRSLTPFEVVKIYNRSRLVLNENLFPGLNLRTFEVMACGVCLLTEDNDRSWKFFFKDGEHLVAYRPETLVDKVGMLLNDEQLREEIAETGWQAIRQCHSIDQRAAELLKKIREFALEKPVAGHRSKRSFYFGRALAQMANRWPQQPVARARNESVKLLMSQLARLDETADLHFELAVNALEQGRPGDAQESLARAMHIDPGHLRSNWAMFWCYRELDQNLKAQRSLEKFIHHLRFEHKETYLEREVSSGLPLGSKHYLLLGKMLESAGWLMQPGFDQARCHPARWNAFDAYQRAINLEPESWEALLQCAALLDRYGVPEFAVMLIEQAARLRPWDAALNFKLGEHLLQSYRRQEGMQQLVSYLVKFTDSDKWERIERLALSEKEWQYLLDKVLDSCRDDESSDRQQQLRDEFKNKIYSHLNKPGKTPPSDAAGAAGY